MGCLLSALNDNTNDNSNFQTNNSSNTYAMGGVGTQNCADQQSSQQQYDGGMPQQQFDGGMPQQQFDGGMPQQQFDGGMVQQQFGDSDGFVTSQQQQDAGLYNWQPLQDCASMPAI